METCTDVLFFKEKRKQNIFLLNLRFIDIHRRQQPFTLEIRPTLSHNVVSRDFGLATQSTKIELKKTAQKHSQN
jgi:hypothetical protein